MKSIYDSRQRLKYLFIAACAFPFAGFAALLAAGYFAPTNAVFVGLCSVIVNVGIGFMLVILTVILSEVVDLAQREGYSLSCFLRRLMIITNRESNRYADCRTLSTLRL